MNIALINLNTNICENVCIFENLEFAEIIFGEQFHIVETKDGFGIGDVYKDNKWVKVSQELRPTEQREKAYETMIYKDDNTTELIKWENKAITVDQANKLYLGYFAENNTKASELQILIISAKEYIRGLYPDVAA